MDPLRYFNVCSGGSAFLVIYWLVLISQVGAFDEMDRLGFLQQKCVDCHSGPDANGGLDVESIKSDFSDPRTAIVWARIHDRVVNGEMPPKDGPSILESERSAFVRSTQRWLTDSEKKQFQQKGRVGARRLTNLQLERTLHDLMGIDIPLVTEIPVESRNAEFNTYADSQTMSHFHLENHLKVVDLALDEMFRRAFVENDDHWQKHFTSKDIARTRDRCREPEWIDDRAVVWASQLIFYGRLPATTVSSSGWYRVRFQASAIKKPSGHGVWCSVRTGQCVSSAPLLGWAGSFEATETPREYSLDVWIPQGHMLEIRPNDRTLKQAKFAGGQASNGEAEPQGVAGIGIDWLSMERIHLSAHQEQIRSLCFEGLEFRDESPRLDESTVDTVSQPPKKKMRLRSTHPKQSIRHSMVRFASRAFRRPIDEAEIENYIAFATRNFEESRDLVSALRSGYRSLLCSPRFLYLEEKPGALDDFAIATRLSYFLWSSMPDERLLTLAQESKLRDRDILKSEVKRMLLATDRGKNFASDFAAQWLELNQIDFTEPDTKLHPDFDLIVQNSMLEETHRFLQHLLNENAPVSRLLDADFTFLNSRLARYYGFGKTLTSDRVELFSLKAEHRRIGLLSHGAVLKVTANGTNTSPVLRGVWIANRILGDAIPPPPDNVPAIEPDIRGTTTIRELLDKHRSDPSCASCHIKMDPPGFALENYDAAGRFRESYQVLKEGKLRNGEVVDASYSLPDGQQFHNLEEFVRLTASKPEKLAKNLAEKLLAYGTGGPVHFADRDSIDEIVSDSQSDRFGILSLIQATVVSEPFLTK